MPDIIRMAEKKENLRSVERMLRRFERASLNTRSLPELVKQLENNQDAVRLLAIKFLALAALSAGEAISALDRMREVPNPRVRKQAQAASDRIKSKAESSQDNGNPARRRQHEYSEVPPSHPPVGHLFRQEREKQGRLYLLSFSREG